LDVAVQRVGDDFLVHPADGRFGTAPLESVRIGLNGLHFNFFAAVAQWGNVSGSFFCFLARDDVIGVQICAILLLHNEENTNEKQGEK
jgi:hypothetical protein